jgi:type I restriction enzyme S subunit
MKPWPTRPLGEVLEISRDRVEPIEHPDTLFNYVGLENIEGHTGQLLPYQPTPGLKIKSTKNVFRSGEILYGKLRPYLNKVHLANTDGICSTDIYVLRPRQRKVYPSFAANYLRSPSVLATVSNAMAGANLPRIGQGVLLDIPIPVPPIAEQERIVNALDEEDELRKLRAQADRRTATLIPALFHDMFGTDGEWPVEQLEHLCKRVTVGHVGPMATEYIENGVTFLRGQNIKRGRLDLSSVLFVSEEFHKRLEKSAIGPGDVVSVRTGKPGITAVIPPSLRVANCADLIVMTCGPQLNPHFLCELLNQRLGDKVSIAGATGIAQQHFNIGEARRVTFALPPLALQEEFAQQVNEIRELEAEQAASRSRLDDLFQSMLHRAFNGEL